jgi:hypothetical protein
MLSFNGLSTSPFVSNLAPQGVFGWYGLSTKLGGGQFAPPQSDGGYPTPEVFDALYDWGQSYYFDGSGFGTSYVKFGDYNNSFGNMYLDIQFQGGEVWLRSELNQIFRLGWLNIEPYYGIAQIGLQSNSFIGIYQYASNGPAFFVSADLIVEIMGQRYLRVTDENGTNNIILLQ